MPHRFWLTLLVLAALGMPLAPAQAAAQSTSSPRAVRLPDAPTGGQVGDGTPASCTESALDAKLAGGGVVTFACGAGTKTIQLANSWTITADTTIIGGFVIVLTSNYTTRLFVVNSGATLRLQNIELYETAIVGADGGAISNHGILDLESSSIQRSYTDNDHRGGAIFSDGPVFMTDSLLDHNAAGDGGALFANSANAAVTIDNSTFSRNYTKNTTTGHGGAIWMGDQSQLTFTDGGLTSNRAQTGGALYLSPNSVATLTGHLLMNISSNSATIDGGAIFSDGGSLSVRGAILTGNQTTTSTIGIGSGGAIFSGGPLSLAHDSFSSNQGRFGGAVFIGGSPVTTTAMLDHLTFFQNTAGSVGGGLYASTDTVAVTVTDSSFDQNTALVAGGGLARFNAPLSIIRTSITHNTAPLGGGLSISAGPGPDHGGYVLVRDTTIGQNTSTSLTPQGGGVANTAWSEFINVTIKDNTNGVFNNHLGAVMFVANTVLDNPGSLNCDGDGTVPQSHAGNFSTDTSCNLTSNGDAQGATLDPKLGPLAVDAFGPTFYYMPLAGSPLIDTAFASCSPRDQRGALRPDACDKGAVEYGGLLPRAFLPFLLR